MAYPYRVMISRDIRLRKLEWWAYIIYVISSPRMMQLLYLEVPEGGRGRLEFPFLGLQ